MISPDNVAEAADRLGSMAMTGSDADQAKQCASCGKTSDALKRCTACKSVWYCGTNCQINHRKVHKKECKRIKKQLEEGCRTDAGGAGAPCAGAARTQKVASGLFDEPMPRPCCAICVVVLPLNPEMSIYATCCGQTFCGGCLYAQLKAIDKINQGKANGQAWIEYSCPFCRTQMLSNDENHLHVERLEKRVKLGDVCAMRTLSGAYVNGDLGLPVDHSKAVELAHRAIDLGSADACVDLGSWYYDGGVGLGKNETKAKMYWEVAAKRGDVDARSNLGDIEHNIREQSMHNSAERKMREELAVAHWRISAAAGSKLSMKSLTEYFETGIIVKEQYEEIERAHNEACEEMKSEDRDRFIEHHKMANGYDGANSDWCYSHRFEDS